MSLNRVAFSGLSVLVALSCPFISPISSLGQDAAVDRPQVPEIPLEPQTISPSTLLPPQLTKKATVKFQRAPLIDIQEWLQRETGLPVVINGSELANEGLSQFDEYSDSLNDAPIYMLLNRLRARTLGWYVEDNIINISTEFDIANKFQTQTYVVSDLIDAGFSDDDLLDTFHAASAGPWHETEQEGGSAQLLGDVLFVNQTYANQLEVAAILAALRKHGLETFLLVSEEDLAIRSALQNKGNANFQNEPLFRVAEILSNQSGLDIRLVTTELQNVGVSPRDTVSLSIVDRPYETILRLLFSRWDLKTVVRDGVVLITSAHVAEEELKTAFYDVRDLCRDDAESEGLEYAIQQQTNVAWLETEGAGGSITFPKPGIMVVRQSVEGLSRVRLLLDAYRNALRVSKPRPKPTEDEADKVVTQFYRIDTQIAVSLIKELWNLIPEGKVAQNAEDKQLGLIQAMPSQSIIRKATSTTNGKKTGTDEAAALIPQTTLIITHKQKIHWEIQKLIQRIESGDPPLVDPSTKQTGGAKGGLGGGGGFGGGFFQVPKK